MAVKTPKAKLLDQAYEIVSIDAVRPHPRNVNQGSIQAITESMRANGFYGALRVQRSTGHIVAGNHSWMAAKEIGLKQVPVIYLDIDNDAALRVMLADNSTARESFNREQELAQLLCEIEKTPQSLYGTGFDGKSLDDLLAKLEQDRETLLENAQQSDQQEEPAASDAVVEDEPPPIDRAEELLEKWKVKPGQIWQIGKHRLMCGDSTDADAVARLMQGEKAGLMNTDPPYGVSYNNAERPNPGVAKPRVAKPRVANDDLSGETLKVFLTSVFIVAKERALDTNAAWYIWFANIVQHWVFAAAAAAAQLKLHRELIWVKPGLLLGRGQYHWRHEPCFFGWVEGKQPPDYGTGNGERNQTTVWEVGSISQADRKDFNHPTPKPVQLFTVPIVKHLKRGEIAYEPFAGSGPQFVAAQQSGMRCYGIEIQPKYCAVILERMEKLGLTPGLASDSDVQQDAAA
jgi:DNA modification methylase/ParB-like chromosome segregation protein Spo0J